jgi:hypothetical protein
MPWPEPTITSVALRQVRVHTVPSQDVSRWDDLMVTHHYLHTRGMICNSLRQVAVDSNGRWLALLGWASGAFRCGARDRWIGWLPTQQFRRLPLVVNNVRFLVLPWVNVPHLASRALGQSVRQLPQAWRNRHGVEPVLAETFVDGSRFSGTCYRAAGWQHLGETRGFGRSNGRYVPHGHVKLVLAKPLHHHACAILRDPEAPTRFLPQETSMDPLALQLTGPGSLKEAFVQIEDPRKASGKEHKDFAGLMTLITMATLAGSKSLRGSAEYISHLPQSILRACGAPLDMANREAQYRAPSEPTIRRAVHMVSGEQLDDIASTWLQSQGYGSSTCAIAMDGKTLRGSQVKGTDQVHLVAAYDHETGSVIAQAETTTKAGELQTTDELIERLGEERLQGAMVTVDALHTQHVRCEQLLKKTQTFC